MAISGRLMVEMQMDVEERSWIYVRLNSYLVPLSRGVRKVRPHCGDPARFLGWAMDLVQADRPTCDIMEVADALLLT